MNGKHYFISELMAITLTSVVLLGLLWITNLLGWITINYKELFIYSMITIMAGLIVLAIRYKILHKKINKKR
jgi:uncharacterized membrane protein